MGRYVTRTNPQSVPVVGSPATDDVLAKAAPALAEYLTATAWEDGASRKTATLLVFAEDGLWKVCLKDREGNASLWVTGKTIQDALASLETRLEEGTGEWRQEKDWKGKAKK